MCVSLCDYVYHVCADTFSFQKISSDSFELELQVNGSHWMWVLVAELWSSTRALSAFKLFSHCSSLMVTILYELF